MKRLSFTLALLIGILLFFGCKSEANYGAEYLPYLTMPKLDVLKALNLSEEELAEARPATGFFSIPTVRNIHGLDFNVRLDFISYLDSQKEEGKELSPPDGTFYAFRYYRQEKEPTDADYAVAEKLLDDLTKLYGEPTDNPWQVGRHISELDSILDIRDGKHSGALERWNVPVPQEWSGKIDPERYYLEATLHVGKWFNFEGSLEIYLEYRIAQTEDEIQEQAAMKRMSREFLPYIGQKREKLFGELGYSEDEIQYNSQTRCWDTTRPFQIWENGFDMECSLYFTEKAKDPLEADEFYGFLYRRRVETPTDGDFKMVKKLAENLTKQYGAPDTEEMLPNHLKDIDNIFDIRDGKKEGAFETWIVPLPEEAEEKLDPARFFLEARLKITRLDQWKEGAIEISLEYCIAPTQEEMAKRYSAY